MGSRWVRSVVRPTGAALAVVFLGLVSADPAGALFLDKGRNFSLRARLYTEAALATQRSEVQTIPRRTTFQLVSHRTVFMPEFDAKLTPYLSFLGLDDIRFRLALWGFYDGIYDYGPRQYERSRKALMAKVSFGHSSTAPISGTDQVIDARHLYAYQGDPVLGRDKGVDHVPDVPFRINEAYIDLSKGPFSLRVGRQAISWGESDTIALLDQNNPFDVTLLPGIFRDIDEARIPLWTIRGSYRLFDNWGPISSAFMDAYLVPGSIDTTVSLTPIPTVSPYSPPETDPQAFLANFTSTVPPQFRPLLDDVLGGLLLVQYDHLPGLNMGNSRYGVRIEGLIDRTYTTSLFFYRTIAQNPVPRFLPFDLSRSPVSLLPVPGKNGPGQLITETVHGLTTVFGATTSFYSAPVNGIIRAEVEYFLDEPGFIPSENIPFEALLRERRLKKFLKDNMGFTPPPGPDQGHIPRADFLRWELGYDRFFFLRPLNPANSFVFVTALVGSWNLTETFDNKDFRFFGQRKWGDEDVRSGATTDLLAKLQKKGAPIADMLRALKTKDDDFVDLKPVEWFIQGHLETNYLHGRLTPGVTVIIYPRGTFVIPVSLTYRYTDWLLFGLNYTTFQGGFFQTGFFRDRDQISARMTLMLN